MTSPARDLCRLGQRLQPQHRGDPDHRPRDEQDERPEPARPVPDHRHEPDRGNRENEADGELHRDRGAGRRPGIRRPRDDGRELRRVRHHGQPPHESDGDEQHQRAVSEQTDDERATARDGHGGRRQPVPAPAVTEGRRRRSSRPPPRRSPRRSGAPRPWWDPRRRAA